MAQKKTDLQKRTVSDLQIHNGEQEKKIERFRPEKTFVPPADIIETIDDIILIIDMPGVNEDDVNVTVDKDTLIIEGLGESINPSNYELNYAEYEMGNYRRKFLLNESIERDEIEGKFNDGVLRLRLPKKAAVKPRKIRVKAG